LLFQLSIDLLQFVPTLKFEYRIDGKIGPEEPDGSSMCVLNRLISYDKKTGVVRYEADPRHAEHIVKELNLGTCKPVSTPSEKPKLADVMAAEERLVLEPAQVSQYRSITMRAAYLSLGRADIAEAVKSLARHMQGPTSYSWGRLKRLGRYLSGKIRVSTHSGCLTLSGSTVTAITQETWKLERVPRALSADWALIR